MVPEGHRRVKKRSVTSRRKHIPKHLVFSLAAECVACATTGARKETHGQFGRGPAGGKNKLSIYLHCQYYLGKHVAVRGAKFMRANARLRIYKIPSLPLPPSPPFPYRRRHDSVTSGSEGDNLSEAPDYSSPRPS